MNVDHFIDLHHASWDRLEVLTQSARRRVDRLDEASFDEMLSLYQQASAHLSHARAQFRDPALTSRLTRVVADAAVVIYGTRVRSWRSVVKFFTHSFPAAVWLSRRFVLVSAALLLGPALVVGVWLGNSDRAVEAAGPEAARQEYVNERFENYYSSAPATQFATEVTVNNIQVAIMAFVIGIAFCVPTALILMFNGANIGKAAGLFSAVGASGKFWGLILPHGLLEITAVIISGAAGLRLGWTLIAPGDRPRGVAMAEEGRRAVVLIIGIMLAFVVAGSIEGFITGSGRPTWLRVGVGVVVETAFVTYLIVRGRIAVSEGFTGAIGET